MFFKTLIFTQFVLNFVTSNPIISSYSKAKAACDSFGDRPISESFENTKISANHAFPGEFPSAVALHYEDGDFRCTGVLISNQFVATSANCLKQKIYKLDFVRLGRVRESLLFQFLQLMKLILDFTECQRHFRLIGDY